MIALRLCSIALLMAGTLASTACSKLPPRPVPLPEARRGLPGWYPQAAWNTTASADRRFLEGKVVFHTARATIRAESIPVLQKLLVFLKDNPDISRIRLEGHTDSRASTVYNQGLSVRRAVVVANWLVDHGLDHNRILAVAFGEARPLWDNALGRAARAENRRTAFRVAEVNGNRFRGKDPTGGGLVLYVQSKAERDAEAAKGEVPVPPKIEVRVEEDIIKPVRQKLKKPSLVPVGVSAVKGVEPKKKDDGDEKDSDEKDSDEK